MILSQGQRDDVRVWFAKPDEFPRGGRCRINQLAVDEQLWRNKVGTHVVDFFEAEVMRRGGWSIYLSCNTNTPGHSFWPTVGYSPIVEKQAGRRGGMNLIWAKLIDVGGFLFPPGVADIKTADSYAFRYYGEKYVPKRSD